MTRKGGLGKGLGALIPPGSRFSLRVEAPEGLGLFPHGDEHVLLDAVIR